MTSTPKKQIRKRGVLPKLIGDLMARHPNISAPEVADTLNMSIQHARNVMRKMRKAELSTLSRGLTIKPGSALDRLAGPRTVGAGVKSNDERRFVAAALMLGLVRAEELLREERARIASEMKVGAA